MQTEPLLSIVTVCFNAQATVADTLRSVDVALAGAAGTRVEHLVVDGMSTDRTAEIVAGHAAPWRRLERDKDSGVYNAMNKGLARSRGDYVWFLNADDMLAEDAASWVRELLERLERERPDVLVGEIQMFRDLPGRRQQTRAWPLPPDLQRARRFGWHPPHPAFIARRALLHSLGGFDERKTLAADFKLMLSALDRAGAGVDRFDHCLVQMREGGLSNGSVKAILRANVECYLALRELGQSRPAAVATVACKLTRKVMQRLTGGPSSNSGSSP